MWQEGQEVDIKAELIEVTILALQEYVSQCMYPHGKTDGNATIKPNKLFFLFFPLFFFFLKAATDHYFDFSKSEKAMPS